MGIGKSVAAVGICAVLVLAGCGGDSSNDSPTLSKADQRALVRVADTMNLAIAEKDGAAFCGVMQPGLVNKVFGSRKTCVKRVIPAMEASGLKTRDITSMAPTDTGASLEFEQTPGRPIAFIKENGTWYLDLTASAPTPSR